MSMKAKYSVSDEQLVNAFVVKLVCIIALYIH